MKPILRHLLPIALILFSSTGFSQEKSYTISKFNEVIVSPHIEVEFKEGKEEKVEVVSITEPLNKLNVDVKNKKLHLYLDDAKITAKQKKSKGKNYSYSESIYKGTVAKLIVTYVDLKSVDLRGEEDFLFKSTLKQSDFRMNIYGASNVLIEEAELSDLRATVYGESTLEIGKGNIDYQKFTVYGNSEINTIDAKNRITKLSSYGEGEYHFDVSEKLQITSFGESVIEYEGNPVINKKMIIGETTIRQKNS